MEEMFDSSELDQLLTYQELRERTRDFQGEKKGYENHLE